MASSASGQDEPNRALWLATRAGKIEPSCPLRTTRCIPQAKFPQKPYNKSFIDQVCSVKTAGYMPCSFFASLWTSTSSRFINTQKKNLANIQPSWPHTWSITHTYYIKVSGIPSGNKWIKTIRYPHMWRYRWFYWYQVCLFIKLYLNSLEYHRNIFGSFPNAFGNLRKFSEILENVRERSFDLRNNFGKF